MRPADGEIERSGIDPSELEQIVREVFRRLESIAAKDKQARNETNLPTATANELILSGRVVSLADVDGRLEKVATVLLARGAILTPAARDYCKQCGVTIQYRATSGKRQASPVAASLVLGVAETNFEPSSVVNHLAQRGISVQQLARTGLVSVVPELCDAVALGGQRGILLTAETAAGLCLANRRRGVRAALANDFTAAEAALRSVAANVLVIDPVRMGTFQLRRVTEGLSRATLNLNDGFAQYLG